jgi:uncharacterized protein (DUF1015 family)
MAAIRPFAAYRYARELGLDPSNLIAPPYDVIDEAMFRSLTDRSDYNISRVDVPHLPPKTVGPDASYAAASDTLRRWISEGIIEQDRRPALYPYEQSYHAHNRVIHRRGFFALVRLSPFGMGDVVPHERTYKGPIEDRLKLMHATGMQLSPVFGLYSDMENRIAPLLFKTLGQPELTATLDAVKNDLWSMPTASIEAQVMDAFKGKPIYIADGHHRYTTALQYQFDCERAAGGELPPDHPANYCLFCLVSMQDAGLQILPTHRILAGLPDFSLLGFVKAIEQHFIVRELKHAPDEALLQRIPQHGFGLYDGVSKQLYSLMSKGTDPLEQTHTEYSPAWRRLDVSVLQHYLIEQVLQPHFNGGNDIARSYSPDVGNAVALTDGSTNRLSLLLRPTPLGALAELGKTGEVMPQKSTYFFPKLATGLIMAPLR